MYRESTPGLFAKSAQALGKRAQRGSNRMHFISQKRLALSIIGIYRVDW
jgi:hypothetical protein